MTRPTLKLPPKKGPAQPAKPPTSRARRAQHGRTPSVAPTPANAAPAAPPSPPAEGVPARAATPPQPKTRNAGADSGTRRRTSRAATAMAPPPVPGAPSGRGAMAGLAPRSSRPATGKPALREKFGSPRTQSATPAPRAFAAPPVHEHPRLSKLMSERGLCSRREADEWIENGWVKVDGITTTVLGTRVPPRAHIDVDPAARRHQSEQVTILLNKPVGYVSGQPEDDYRPAIVLIRPENRWPGDKSPRKFKPSQLRGLAPAGRLDIDSTGLLVFTQDGRIAKRLVGEKSDVEKEYLVRVEGALTPEGLKLLQHGLELDGVKLKPARVSWQNESQLRFVLREGRKRQIRRMCELVGLKVTGLKRVRSGSVSLGPLTEGQWRYLRPDEKF